MLREVPSHGVRRPLWVRLHRLNVFLNCKTLGFHKLQAIMKACVDTIAGQWGPAAFFGWRKGLILCQRILYKIIVSMTTGKRHGGGQGRWPLFSSGLSGAKTPWFVAFKGNKKKRRGARVPLELDSQGSGPVTLPRMLQSARFRVRLNTEIGGAQLAIFS